MCINVHNLKNKKTRKHTGKILNTIRGQQVCHPAQKKTRLEMWEGEPVPNGFRNLVSF